MATLQLPDFHMPMSAFSSTTKGRMPVATMAEQLGGHQDAVCSRYDEIGAHNHYIVANDTGWYIIPMVPMQRISSKPLQAFILNADS